ncbi:MAG: PDZ domain-containing protein [Planctomycetaceae bacterium]|nr:PDZ domain-containing protein [Planctomycetaceae bacterium]
MIDRLSFQPNRILSVLILPLVLISLRTGTVEAEESLAPPPSQTQDSYTDEEVQRLIQALGSPDYQTREEATRKLATAPPEIIPHLKAAALQGDLEVTVRAIQIMEQHLQHQATLWFTTLHPELLLKQAYRKPAFAEHPARQQRLEKAAFHFDQIDLTLSELAESPFASLALRARKAVQTERLRIELKAMLDTIDLGGQFFYLRNSGRGQNYVVITREMVMHGHIPTEKLGIQIDRHWKNAPDALQKLKRVKSLKSIYLIKGAPLTREEIQQIQIAIPEVTVQTRGAVRLGVTHMPLFNNNFEGAPVGEVANGSSADQAGIQSGDVITRLAEHNISDFEALVRSLENYEAGDIVEVELKRGAQTLLLKVELSSW